MWHKVELWRLSVSHSGLGLGLGCLTSQSVTSTIDHCWLDWCHLIFIVLHTSTTVTYCISVKHKRRMWKCVAVSLLMSFRVS